MSDRLDEMLENVQWGVFPLTNIFENITSSSSQMDRNAISYVGDNNVSYVTRTDANNGASEYIPYQDNVDPNESGVITLGLDTQTLFYQPSKFYTGQNIQILSGIGRPLSKYLALFLIAALNKQMSKFNWGGNGATLTRLRKVSILLPIINENEPDWHFMETFMKEVERNVRPVIEFEPHAITDTRELDAVAWKVFVVGDLFEELNSGKSKGLNHLTQGGDIPYVAATNRNNGVSTFVQNYPDLISKGSTVVFIRNGEGSMGYSIYKSEDFIATSDVTMGYHRMLNKYTGMFVTTVADTVRGKYNFGYKRSAKRLKREGLLLPVTSNGQPDWHYMEQYMRRLENQLMTQI